MRRGEVWWALLQPKSRPVVLVSRDSHLLARDIVNVTPLTTRVRGLQSEVPLGPDDGVARPCVADAGTILHVRKSLLVRKIAALSPSKRGALDAALRFSLGLD